MPSAKVNEDRKLHPMCARIVTETPLPSESGIADWFDGADLADAFAVDLDSTDTAKGADYLARCVMEDPALWVRMLLTIRDMLVAAFGIKTSGQLRLRAATERLAHIDFFRVLSRSDNEVIVGEDDWHLNFRASVMIRRHRNGRAQLPGYHGSPLPEFHRPDLSLPDRSISSMDRPGKFKTCSQKGVASG